MKTFTVSDQTIAQKEDQLVECRKGLEACDANEPHMYLVFARKITHLVQDIEFLKRFKQKLKGEQ